MVPNDPVMLLSYVNTQLRDNYSSLEEFCKSAGISKDEIVSRLRTIDYEYEEKQNQFI